jgi:hypothetical protein
MDGRADIEDKWEQLLWALGEGEKLRLCNDDDGRAAAILQLHAVLELLDQTAAHGLTIPLVILSRALQDPTAWCQAANACAENSGKPSAR